MRSEWSLQNEERWLITGQIALYPLKKFNL